MSSWPPWLNALIPASEPRVGPLRPGSEVAVWHIPVAFRALPLTTGRALDGADTWNGKALVVPSVTSIERSVGEVELAQRLRDNLRRPNSFWTAGKGNPPEIRRPWALGADLRSSWFSGLDAEVRRGDALLLGNARGTPDILSWDHGSSDAVFVLSTRVPVQPIHAGSM